MVSGPQPTAALSLPSRPEDARANQLTSSTDRMVAIVLIGVVLGVTTAVLWMHRDASGSDAYAYWYGVHVWLAGGDPYQVHNGALPWHYPPWMLPLLLPWALMPWNVAWPVWRILTTGSLLLSLHWAFGRRPIATARTAAVLAVPMGIALDTGNVIVLCALALWAAQFSGPRRAGLFWAGVTAVKWFPIVFWLTLSRRAKSWGFVFLLAGLAVSLATWRWTLEEVASITMTGVPHTESVIALRLDHLAIAWALVPLLWRHELAWLEGRWSAARQTVRLVLKVPRRRQVA